MGLVNLSHSCPWVERTWFGAWAGLSFSVLEWP